MSYKEFRIDREILRLKEKKIGNQKRINGIKVENEKIDLEIKRLKEKRKG